MEHGTIVRQINPSRILPGSKAASPFETGVEQNYTSNYRITLMALAQERPGAVLSTMDRLAVVGIERKIREAYRHLCLTYTDKKDEIILIGFSRGAFTVRCLASLINDVGLLDGTWVNKELPAIFELWKKQKSSDQNNDLADKKSTPLEEHCQALIAKYENTKQQPTGGKRRGKFLRRGVHIKACAVWDTVKSLGFPWPKRVPHKKSKRYNFVNHRLTPNIDNAFQALSLDERRWHFPPVIWSKSHRNQALKQCWFLGSHSDIGGGYRNAGFANISLCWMISQLREFVLFDEEAIWHSTEDGKIFGIDVAKENRELFTHPRGRMIGMVDRNLQFLRARSGPPGEKIQSNSQKSFRSISGNLSRSRDRRSQNSIKDSLATNSDVPSITVSKDIPEPDSKNLERDAENIYEPSLSVPSDVEVVTPYEASLNPEAEAVNTQEDSDESSSTTSDAGRSERLPLAITNMRRHTWQGAWVFGGSKTRKVGIYRTIGDDLRSSRGKPPRFTEDDQLGSNESIHFSVRALTELHPLQGRTRCRALQKFEIQETPGGRPVWHHKKADSNMREIPQDTVAEYEKSMLHRWLDRDFAARENFGGQQASEAIAGSALSGASDEEAQPEQSMPQWSQLSQSSQSSHSSHSSLYA
ncbi:hypothetical protein MMC17_010026 [Xylographa soralifera]|nr:hypothetical protein [Xylographa soralifera]